jgi:GDP-L-fucose synthase
VKVRIGRHLARCCLLPVNLCGPGYNFDPASSNVIPALIRKWVDARDRGQATIAVSGTGSASREFPYVEHAAMGIVLKAEHCDGGDPVDLGIGREITIRELVELIARLTGFTSSIRWHSTKSDGQPRRALDASRVRKAFGFVAGTSFEDGLRWTIEWYEASRASIPKGAR